MHRSTITIHLLSQNCYTSTTPSHYVSPTSPRTTVLFFSSKSRVTILHLNKTHALVKTLLSLSQKKIKQDFNPLFNAPLVRIKYDMHPALLHTPLVFSPTCIHIPSLISTSTSVHLYCMKPCLVLGYSRLAYCPVILSAPTPTKKSYRTPFKGKWVTREGEIAEPLTTVQA